MAKIAIALSMLLMSTFALAQNVDVKGLRLNETTKAEAVKALPLHCKKTAPDIKLWQESCALPKKHGLQYGDVPIKDGLVLLADGLVHKVVLSFEYSNRDRIRQLVNQKFEARSSTCDLLEPSCLWLVDEQIIRLVDQQREVWLEFDGHNNDPKLSKRLGDMKASDRTKADRAIGNM